MAYAGQFGLHVCGGDHIAICKMPKVQFHARLKAPFQRDFINGDRRFFMAQGLVLGGVEVVGRIQVGAVVGAQLDKLHRPTFAIGQVLLAQPRKKRLNLFHRVFVV